jgi:hypothetical protein
MGGGDLSDLSDMGDLGAAGGASGTGDAGTSAPGPVGPPPGRPRAGGLLVFAGGILATLALVAALVLWWPDDDAPVRADDTAAQPLDTIDPGATGSTTAGSGEPSQTTAPPATAPSAPADDLFGGDLPAAVDALVSAAGGPTQAIGLSVYPDYAFLAYRDPGRPADLDRRMWRDGEVGPAAPNPIDDRVDADTEPQLFPISGLDLGILPRLVADAATRYDREVEVTHVIIDRFLPFDPRVLIRVYATPADGRSGGGYVSYDTGGALVGVCC